jgi:hypothetical protein
VNNVRLVALLPPQPVDLLHHEHVSFLQHSRIELTVMIVIPYLLTLIDSSEVTLMGKLAIVMKHLSFILIVVHTKSTEM